jgi:ABC-type nitrate/sulfonate/bicarbonate transport system permease component
MPAEENVLRTSSRKFRKAFFFEAEIFLKEKNIVRIIKQIIPFAAIVLLWQMVCLFNFVPEFMLPSPIRVLSALASDITLLLRHLLSTLYEAVTGLVLAAAASFLLAVILDVSHLLKQSLTPLLLVTQTIPTIALAPLLILWMGYGIAPKITLVFIVCFFPMTIGLSGAFAQTDPDAIRLMKTMGASRRQIYRYLKIPQGLPAFFSGLKISGSYSIIGAVIAEWLGGDSGLGVYMIRVRRSYSFDKMFAVILLVSVLSILLIKLIGIIEKHALPYNKIKNF